MDEQTRNLCNDAFLGELDDIRKTKIGGADGQAGLRQAFPYWFVKKFLRVDNDNEIKDIIKIGAGGDFECDFFAVMNEDGTISTDGDGFSEEEKTIVWGQAKLADSMDGDAFNTGNLEKVRAVEEHLKETDPELERIGANDEFRKKAKLFQELTVRTSGAPWRGRIKVLIAVAGKIQPQAKSLLDEGSEWRLHNDFAGMTDERRVLATFEIEDVLTRMMLPKTPDVIVRFVEEPIEKFDRYEMDPSTYRQPDHRQNHPENNGECDCQVKGNRSLVGHISANDLIKLHTGPEGVGDTIFLENPRRFLGEKKATYTSMLETLEKNQAPNGKLRFWKFNNGVTATCDKISDEPDGRYRIENMKIVNGQQTTTTLTDNDSLVKDDEGIQVGLRIHVTTDENERKAISKSTNRQNALSGEEMMDIGEEHKNLKLQCEQEYPKYYYERQKEGYLVEPDEVKVRVTERRRLIKADTAISFYAYYVDAQRAMLLGAGKIFKEDLPHDYKLVYFKDPVTIPESVGSDNRRIQAQKYGPVKQEEPAAGVVSSPGLAGNVKPEGYRHVRELIIAHIFHHLLNKINTKWTSLTNKYNKWVEVGSDPTTLDDITDNQFWLTSLTGDVDSKHRRFSDLAGKRLLQYWVLSWINDSMKRFSDTEKRTIEEKLIEVFGDIRRETDPLPDELYNIAKVAWDTFLQAYDWNTAEQWFGLTFAPSAENTMKHLRITDEMMKKLRGYNETIMTNKRGLDPSGASTGDDLMDALKKILPA